MSLLTTYKERVQLQHGWEVELRCPDCNHEGVPEVERIQNTTVNVINAGRNPHVFANVTCSECGHDLKTIAEETLVTMFNNVSLSPRNKLIIFVFIVMVIVVLLSMVGIWYEPLNWLAPAQIPVVVILLLSYPAFNYWIHSLRICCECGNPKYLFLGLLGRSYCYRCSSCGRMLRLWF